MKKYFLFLVFILAILPRNVYASEASHYVTIVNPVRGRNLWRSVDSVQKQIKLISDSKLPSTWLLQYDVLADDESLKLFQNLSKDQELGVFLEVSEKLATDTYVPYLFGDGDWARADKVLLSGYLPSERKRMIDLLFDKFREKFGYYPKSVGSWYIDTLSLDYLTQKYHIDASLDVADQYSTDKYGLWGKPWGTPYVPSYFNSLIPSGSMVDKSGTVKIQWAQRDPVRGFGLNAADSIYSVQANDYINNKLDINYFKHLSNIYLNAPNSFTQLTVGLEAGQEGADFLDEFTKQIQYLRKLQDGDKLTFLTMSAFAGVYRNKSFKSSTGTFIYGEDYKDPETKAYWYSNDSYRIGLLLQNHQLIIRDFRVFQDYFMDPDIFTSDSHHDLKRIIPSVIDKELNRNSRILFSDVDQIESVKNGNTAEILLRVNNGVKHSISLKEDKVLADNHVIFEIISTRIINRSFSDYLARATLNYWLNLPHSWVGDWRSSKIENVFFFGFTIAPDKLMGIKSEFPYLGLFNIPFQTLVRFRSLPKPDMAKSISENLVKLLNNSTIRIVRTYPL